MRHNLFFTVFFLFLFNSCSNDNVVETHREIEAAEFLNVNYGVEQNQNYDIYLPENRTTSTPLIIMIHGGFWAYGDKTDMNDLVLMAKTLAPDYAVVNMNYRLATTNSNHYPTQLDDISLVIQELKNKKSEYQISDDYYFIGVSAGGHLSLLYSYKEDIDHDIKAVCSIVGPTDFLDPSYHDSNDPFFQSVALQFLGYTYEENPSLYQEVSATQHIDEYDAPTILFYGDKDELVPLSQAGRLETGLIDAYIPYEYYVLENIGHDLVGINEFDIGLKIAAFFEKYR